MEDTICSGSEETTLKSDVSIENSESAVAQGTIKEQSTDSKQENTARSLRSCVPTIVVMDSASGSFSTSDSLKSKDTSSSTKKNKRRGKKKQRKEDQDMRASVLAEGQQLGEVGRSEATAISSEPRLVESGWTELSLAKANTALEKHIAMERADIISPYSSDEWEADSGNSGTDDDHTDSSDDDDPKSQVDRLIERGTLIYMDGENSALSSEGESDDSDDYDSESDITDVSPLMSATASPLGLSPVLPRRTIPTSPLALHDNRELSFGYGPDQSPFIWDLPSPGSHHNTQIHDGTIDNHHASTNMDLLLQAVIELENKNQASQYNSNLNHHNHNHNSRYTDHPPHHSNDQVFIHPIRDNPHHHHLRKNSNIRKNMSFSNEEVRKIDHENKILLKKIMSAHTRVKPNALLQNQHHHSRPSNSYVNRKKGEEKIRRDNLLLFKKIQEAKPSKEVVESRLPGGVGLEPLLVPNNTTRSQVLPNGTAIRTQNNSCAASLRNISQASNSNVSTRKETAL